MVSTPGQPAPRPAKDGRRLLGASVGQWIGAVLLIAGAVTFIVMFDRQRVCNDTITSAGNRVEACRHLEITDPPVVAVGLLMLAAMTPFVAEISGFGLTVKWRLDRVERRVEEESDKNERTASAVEIAQEQAREALDLARRYSQVRRAYQSGAQRDRLMNSMWSALVEQAIGMQRRGISAGLVSPDEGRRLAAYAHAYAHPDPEFLGELAQAVLRDTRVPFNQEMGLRSLRQVLQGHSELFTPELRHQIETLRDELQQRADRKGRPSKRVGEIEALLAESTR